MLAFSSCVKSKLEVTYNSQESKIESYIASKGDTYRSIRNGGANRLVLKEGEGEELQRNGFVSFYYAGYKFSGSFSSGNLFVTNHQATAEQSGWNLTDADYQIYEINLADAKLVRVGMRQDLIDHANDHIAETSLNIFHILDLDSVHSQVVSQFVQICICREVHIIPDPG